MFTDQRRSLLSMLVGLAAIGLFSGFASGADLSSNGLASLRRHPHSELHHAERPGLEQLPGRLAVRRSHPRRRTSRPTATRTRGATCCSIPGTPTRPAAAGSDDWWFIVQRYWPSSYQPSNHGNWGREVNFHNVAGDAGPGGGIGWSFGSGVSSLALDWLPGQNAPQFTVEPDHPNENIAAAVREPRHLAHLRRPLRRRPHRRHDAPPRRDHGLGRRLRRAGDQR